MTGTSECDTEQQQHGGLVRCRRRLQLVLVRLKDVREHITDSSQTITILQTNPFLKGPNMNDEARKSPESKMLKTMRLIEYYRLWPCGLGDSGIWDTDFVEIPADTPDNQIHYAIEEAVAEMQWREEPPAITGYYSDVDTEEKDDEEDEEN